MTRFSKPKRLVRNGVASEFFYVRMREDGRRSWRSTGAKTLALAREVIETWRLRDAKGERHVEDLAFEDAAKLWLTGKDTRVSRSCFVVYRVFADSLIRTFGKKVFRSIEPKDLETHFAKRAKVRRGDRLLSPRSLNGERSVARMIFRFAMANGWISRDPMALVAKFRETVRQVRALDEAEETRLLSECRLVGEDVEAFVLALLRSGIRRGTLGKLEADHVDWQRGEWQIPAALMKSRSDFVGVPIEPDLFERLKALRRPAGRLLRKLDVRKLRVAAERAGLGWFKPHDARRSFVSRCRRRGVPLEVAMRLSDHRDLATVLASYRSIEPDELRSAMRTAFEADSPQAVDGAAGVS